MGRQAEPEAICRADVGGIPWEKEECQPDGGPQGKEHCLGVGRSG